jgi:hypothetical protein
MSLSKNINILILFLSTVYQVGFCQTFSSQGMLSGSGLIIIPTTVSAPPAEFRASFSRLSLLSRNTRGLNVWAINGGLSSHLELYTKLMGEQLGTFSSLISYGFGAKLHSPFEMPYINQYAIWIESVTSDQLQVGTLNPSKVFRGGLTASFGTDGIDPVILLGIAIVNKSTKPLIGGGVTIAASHTLQLGSEIVYGYASENSMHLLVNASTRIFSNICLTISPGYISSKNVSTWIFSAGISASSSDIDFHPVREERIDEFKLPSIEEMEKQSNEEKKNE